ncbi:MAG: hypothetical protein JF618_14565, partial [Leifsonia sp.]|nr:hypothetical protein [Leifsonia sp.]
MRLVERDLGTLRPIAPALRVLVAPELFEHFGVRVEEVGAVGERPIGIQLRYLQFGQGGLRLIEIEAGAGHGDRQGDLDIGGQRGAVDRAAEFQRAVGTPHPAFAVHHQRKLVVRTGNAPVGAKLAERESEVARCVRRDSKSLAHNGHSAGAARSRHRVLMSPLRIGVDQAAGHHQVLGDLIRIV